jgi:hypothetical protein
MAIVMIALLVYVRQAGGRSAAHHG